MNRETILKVWMRRSSVNIDIFLSVSIILTEMVINYHKRHEVVGILTPGNIKIREDFKLAAVTGATQWDAAYRAPEYSGRLNRTPDERSDLYSLGVIFYELLAGKLPFQVGSNDEDWLMAHMFDAPFPLSHYRPELEEPIQSIIMKLLAKSPDERYQTGWGLLVDLEQCAAHLEQHRKLMDVDIGRWDEVSQFRYPSMLVGREEERLQLAVAYERVVAGNSTVLVSIQGEEGVGKTSLTEQFLHSLRISGVMVISGVCEAEQRSMLFGPIYQAVRLGLEQLWGESADELALMREIFKRELGDQIYVLQHHVPEVNTWLGLQLSIEDMPYFDSDYIGKALVAILRCFSQYRKPLVLFIDHLQWADEGTIEVIHMISQEHTLTSLMCIGSFRNGSEVSNVIEPPDNIKLSKIRWTKEILLKPLFYNDVRSILTSILHEDSKRIRVLARSLYDQTQGNPANIKALLHKWVQENKLRFDNQQYRWTWDAALQYSSEEVPPDVFQLYENGYNRLSDDAKQLMQVAAIIGFKFHSALLGEVCGYSPIDIIVLLDEAEKEGLVYCEDDVTDHKEDLVYTFMHPSLLNNLLLLQDEVIKLQWHYQIGLQMKKRLSGDHSEGQVIPTVDHLNPCHELMTTEELLELAQLNYRAGETSFKNREFTKSNVYTETGIQILEQLESPITITFDLYMHLALSEYMCGNIENLHKYMAYLMSQRRQLTREMLLRLTFYQLEMYALENNAEAVRIGRMALAEYGWILPERVSVWTAFSEVVKTQLALKKNFEVNDSSVNDDQDYELTSRLVISMSVPLLIVDPLLLIVLFSRFIRYGLKKGNNKYFLSLIASYEFFLQRGMPFIHQWLPTGAIDKLNASPLSNEATEYRLPFSIGMYKQLNNPHETTSYLFKAALRAIEYNDATMANFSLLTILVSHHGNVHELMKMNAFIENEAAYIIDEKTAAALKVASDYCSSLQDEHQVLQFITIPLAKDEYEIAKEDSYICVSKLEAAYYCEQYETALIWARRGKELEQPADWMINRKLRFFEGLAWAALYRDVEPNRQQEIKQSFRRLLRKMKQWKGYWGKHSSGYLLIQAEWNRMQGKKQDTLINYEAAIKISRKENYSVLEAIALERVYDYYSQEGVLSGYNVVLIDACAKYAEWGVNVKVNRLKQKHPDIMWFHDKIDTGQLIEAESLEIMDQDSISIERKRFIDQAQNDDLLSQIVSWSGKAGPGLLDQFLRTVILQVGADRGCIIRWEGEECSVEAYADRKISNREQMEYATSISRYVRKTGRPVVLDDVLRSLYVSDRYITLRQPASLLCMSMGPSVNGIHQQIYLENSQVSGVFIERDLHVLELLITRLNYVYWMENISQQEAQYPNSMALDNSEKQLQLSRKEQGYQLIEPLTPREMEVLVALTAGFSNKEIAAELGISEATVKTHVFNLYGKLQVKRRGQAIARAKELELV